MKKLIRTTSLFLVSIILIVFIVLVIKNSETLQTISLFPAIIFTIATVTIIVTRIVQKKNIAEKDLQETSSNSNMKLEDIDCSTVSIEHKIYSQLSSENELETALAIISNRSKSISSYIRNLSYSLYMNLAIGMLFASLSISFLYLLYIAPVDANIINKENAPFRYFQLAFPISLQILSIFFLGLYKKTALEIKYMNNEITNIELKKAALAMSNSFSEENKSHLAKALINTERNFILKKGESTHHVELAKSDSTEMIELLKTLQIIAKK